LGPMTDPVRVTPTTAALWLLALCPPFTAGEVRVIGLGHARTGTESLAVAMQMLGLGPGYTWREVVGSGFNKHAYRRRDIDLWSTALEGPPDFNTVFANYSTVVGAPASMFLGDLRKKYPDAKVILTKRSSTRPSWFKSISYSFCLFYEGSALDAVRSSGFFTSIISSWSLLQEMRRASDAAATRSLGARFPEGHHWDTACADPEYAERVYNAWNQLVEETVPAGQLLVFETGKHGYKELCAFLGVPEPTPAPDGNYVRYPWQNSRGEFGILVRYYWAETIMVYLLPIMPLIALAIWYKPGKLELWRRLGKSKEC